MIALYDDHNNAATTNNGDGTSKPKRKNVTSAPLQQDSLRKEHQHAFNRMATNSGNVTLLVLGSVRRVLKRVNNLLTQVYARHQQRRADRLALQQLLQFNDYLLRDMGLNRSDIVSIKLDSLSLDAEIKKRLVARSDHHVADHHVADHDFAEHNTAEHNGCSTTAK